MKQIGCDVLIVGAGLGGCAAALAATDAGRRVIMTEPTDWIGGQATQQAVPSDENRWVETFGCTASYQRFRQSIRDYYRTWYPLNPAARANERLNPGGGTVSRLCHEPKVALAVLEGMLAPALSAGRLRILREHDPVSADVDGDRVRGVAFRDRGTNDEVFVTAEVFLDASELGDLIDLAGCEIVTGFESQADHGEPHAPAEPQPDNIQSATWCFAMDLVDGDHVIDRPESYSFWRDYVPDLTPPWPGPMQRFPYSDPRTLKSHPAQLEPAEYGSGILSLWRYRQIQDPSIYEPGLFAESVCPGVSIANWPQTDYVRGGLWGDGAEEHWRGAKEQALCFFYWLQTEAPRADGGTGFPGLRLRPDVTGTCDGFAKHPYVRESRRIAARFTVTECHIGVDARKGLQAAEGFADSVGIGHYGIDLHPSTGGDNYIDVPSYPFQIPLGALVPVRMVNLIPACKNIGVTHIANGCYRLHPVEWSIGEAAGHLAHVCLERGLPAAGIWESAAELGDFQQRLAGHGIPLAWPDEL